MVIGKTKKKEFFIRIDPKDGHTILEVFLPKSRKCFNPSCNKKYQGKQDEFTRYCPSCMTDSIKCEGCGKEHLKLDLHKVILYDGTSQYYCDSCFRKDIILCPVCSKHVHNKHVKKSGAVNLCPTCFKDHGECEICLSLINLTSSHKYKDEFHEYKVLCKNCLKTVKTYIPQNVNIIRSKDQLASDFLVKKKSLPIARFQHVIVGSADIGIRKIITYLRDKDLMTKHRVYIFGTKSRDSGVYIKGLQYLGDVSLGRWEAKVHQPIHNHSKAPIEIGLDRNLRESPDIACRIIQSAISKIAKVGE